MMERITVEQLHARFKALGRASAMANLFKNQGNVLEPLMVWPTMLRLRSQFCVHRNLGAHLMPSNTHGGEI